MSDAQIQALQNKLDQAIATGDEKAAAKTEKKLRRALAKVGVDYDEIAAQANPMQQPSVVVTQENAPEPQVNAAVGNTQNISATAPIKQTNIYAAPPKGRRAKKAWVKAHEVELEINRSDTATQALMGFELLFPDGVMRLDANHYSCTVELDDVNYVGCRDDDQETKLVEWKRWLDHIDDDVSVQILVVTRQISREAFEDKLELPLVAGDDKLNVYRQEINAWCKDKLNKSTRSMRRRRLCTITVTADTYEKAAPKLATEANKLIKTMQALDSDAKVLNAQERLDALRLLTHQDEEPGTVNLKEELNLGVGLSAIDLAAPYRLVRMNEFNGDSRLMVGKRYVKSLTMPVDGYGISQRDNLITNLISAPYDVSVAVHIRPWDSGVAEQLVSKQLFEVQEENHSYQLKQSKPQAGYFVDSDNMPIVMKEAENEALNLREDLKDQHLYSVVINVLCEGKTPEELKAAVEEIESIFKTHKKSTPDSWDALREDAFTSTLPTGALKLPYERTLTSDPLSRLIPFATMEIKDEGGLIMGINADSRAFITYDPVKHEHANALVFAQPGKGKSFGMKWTRILQNVLQHPDADKIIIDPEGEETNLVKMLGGIVLEISQDPNSPTKINPLDISTSYGDENSLALARSSKVSFLLDLVRVMCPTITTTQIAALDRIGMDAYSKWTLEPKPENIPTFQDIFDVLKDHESKEVRQLAEEIRPFIDGSQALFNSQTTVDMSNHLVCFDLSKLSEATKRIALLVLLDHIWVRVTRNKNEGRRTWLVVDEFQLLMDDEAALRQFDHFFSRGRKWDLYEIAATQNLDRFITTPRALAMLTSTPFLTFYNQTEAATKTFANLLSLSPQQIQTLKTAKPGEGLYVIGNKVIHFDLTVDRDICPKIYDAITTRPSELAKIRNKALASKQKNVDAPTNAYVDSLRAQLADLVDENNKLKEQITQLEELHAAEEQNKSSVVQSAANTQINSELLAQIQGLIAAVEQNKPKEVANETVGNEFSETGELGQLEEPEDAGEPQAQAVGTSEQEEAAVESGSISDENVNAVVTTEAKEDGEDQAQQVSAVSERAQEAAHAEGLSVEEAYGSDGELCDDTEDSTFNPFNIRKGFLNPSKHE